MSKFSKRKLNKRNKLKYTQVLVHSAEVTDAVSHQGAAPGAESAVYECRVAAYRFGAGVDVQRRVGAGESSPGGGVQTDPPGGNTGAWAESAVYGCVVVVVQGRSWR